MKEGDENTAKTPKKEYSSHKLKSSKTTSNLQDIVSEFDEPKPKPRSKSDYGKLQSKSQSRPASVPISKIFVEVEDGFKRINPNSLKPKAHVSNETAATLSKENVFKNLAYQSQTYFHQISTLCHGLLAGIALWHCVTIFNLSPPQNSWKDFLYHYSNLAHGYQAVFFFLNVTCVVSVCDRFNIAANAVETLLSFHRDRKLALFALFFYPVSLLITISVTNVEDMIQSHKHANKSTWWDSMSDNGINVDEKLELWRWLSLIRGIMVILGWLLIGVQSEKDIFLETFKENS